MPRPTWATVRCCGWSCMNAELRAACRSCKRWWNSQLLIKGSQGGVMTQPGSASSPFREGALRVDDESVQETRACWTSLTDPPPRSERTCRNPPRSVKVPVNDSFFQDPDSDPNGTFERGCGSVPLQRVRANVQLAGRTTMCDGVTERLIQSFRRWAPLWGQGTDFGGCCCPTPIDS